MAQQDGIFKIKGTLGGVTFYKTKDGYMAREKGGIDRKRMATDPAFRRTRENGQEFGTAGKYGKYLRAAIRSVMQSASDKRVVSRLVKKLMEILKTDAVNVRGLRNPVDGELGLLKGFEFNVDGQLSATLFTQYTAVLERPGGTAQVEIPEMIPTQMIKAPGGTTHYKIVSAAAEVDFLEGMSLLITDASPILPYDDVETVPVILQTDVTPASALPLVQLLGIEFYQEVNGNFYMLNNGSFNALMIVNVNKP